MEKVKAIFTPMTQEEKLIHNFLQLLDETTLLAINRQIKTGNINPDEFEHISQIPFLDIQKFLKDYGNKSYFLTILKKKLRKPNYGIIKPLEITKEKVLELLGNTYLLNQQSDVSRISNVLE